MTDCCINPDFKTADDHIKSFGILPLSKISLIVFKKIRIILNQKNVPDEDFEFVKFLLWSVNLFKYNKN